MTELIYFMPLPKPRMDEMSSVVLQHDPIFAIIIYHPGRITCSSLCFPYHGSRNCQFRAAKSAAKIFDDKLGQFKGLRGAPFAYMETLALLNYEMGAGGLVSGQCPVSLDQAIAPDMP